MRIRRTLPVAVAVLVIAGAVALIVFLRGQAPPEAARLLPGADGFLYVNLKWIRTFNATGQLPAVSHEPDYQQFVEETGFQFERDLDEAAFAIHYPESWNNGTGGPVSEPRFSEIFVGRIDSSRLTAYLKKLASTIEQYRGFDIYDVPREDRIVRVVLLSYNTVAASNHPDPSVIRGVIDRSRKLASPFGGPWLLRRYYRKVPLASLAFAILRIEPAHMDSVGGFGNWSLLFPKPAVLLISARYLRALHLRAEAFTNTEADAQAIADKVAAFLAIFRAAESSVGTHGTDSDVKALFESLQVERIGERAVLTATVPPGFIRKALSEPPAAPTPAPPPAPMPPSNERRAVPKPKARQH
jgi:hypothetical protein